MSKPRVKYYFDKAPDGGDLVSIYGDGWQQAYHLSKDLLEYWRTEAKQKKRKQ